MNILKQSFVSVAVVSGFIGGFAGNFAQAGVVSSPFGLRVQASTLNQLLASSDTIHAMSGEVTLPIADQAFGEAGAIKLEGIALDLKYAFQKPVPSADFGNWDLELQDASAQLTVKHVDATQTIQIQQGGVVLNLKLNATCDDVVMSLPSGVTHASAKLLFALQDGKPSFQLQNFTADWKPSSWKVTSMKCQGPNGVDQFAATQAEAGLRTINPFFDQIENAIATQLSALGTNQIAFTFNVAMGTNASAPVSLTLRPRTFTASPGDHIVLDGLADFSFPGLDAKCDQLAPQAENFIIQDSSPILQEPGDALVFPFSVINRIIQCGYNTPQTRVHVNSSAIPALNSFLRNPFAKMVIWPDLLRLGWHPTMQLDLGLTAPATIGVPTRVAQGVIDMPLTLPLVVSVNVPQKKQYVHYVDLTANLEGPSQWTFIGDTVTIQQRVQDLNIGADWDQDYAHRHHIWKPFEAINTGLLTNQFEKYLFEQGIQYQIPSLVLSQSLKITTTDVDYGDGNLRIGIKLDSIPPPSP